MLLFINGCSIITTNPEKKTAEERINSFPENNYPIKESATVYWNENMVPFIEAENDEDGAFVLGVVHAHQRLAQMELVRMIAQGRLSEMFGPLTRDIDHSLRILNITKASDEIVQNLPPETMSWVSAFVRGVNWYVSQAEELPVEFELLDIEPHQWTMNDMYDIARLISVDLSFMLYAQFLRLENKLERDKLWSQYIAAGQRSIPSYSVAGFDGLMNILSGFSKSGSNSLVVSAQKSANGHALMANDPHLGIFAPNIWMIVGYKTKSYHTVGLQFPGIPFVAVGRNPHIAWGGTNMRSISSHIYKLSDDDLKNAKSRFDTIRSRWWFSKDITIRDSEYGPILTDSPFFEDNGFPVAVDWLGHKPSYELTAFLKANKATDFKEFREAFERYAVSGQAMLYADNKGNIGQILAYQQPVLKDPDKTLDLVKSTDNPIAGVLTPLQLPYSYNPEKGFIASANNMPFKPAIPIAYAYSGKNRMQRMTAVISQNDKISVEVLKELQTDVMSYIALDIKNLLVDKVKQYDNEISGLYPEYWSVFKNWDGRYDKSLRGPVAYETLMYFVAKQLIEEQYKNESSIDAVIGGDNWENILPFYINDKSETQMKKIVLHAAEQGKEHFLAYNNWGEMHRMNFGPSFARIPVIGKRYLISNYGVSGSSNTLMKTAHEFTPEKHTIFYGSNSRHISDMSDIDNNWFVLLGGQDGWLKSPFNADQLQLWENKQYVHVPLRIESVRKEFDFHVSKLSK
jgi:penicillin G amidase